MTQSPSVTFFRDLLFRFPYTAALNAAGHHEAQQIYAGPDRMLLKCIVPAAAARYLQQLDSEGNIFYVQLKTLPPEALDVHSESPEYGVVWVASAWRDSTEFQLTRSAAALARAEDYQRRAHAEARIDRIMANILRYFPTVEGLPRLFNSIKGNEDTLKHIADSFAKAYHEQYPHLSIPVIYEEPTSTDQQAHGAAPEDARESRTVAQ